MIFLNIKIGLYAFSNSYTSNNNYMFYLLLLSNLSAGEFKSNKNSKERRQEAVEFDLRNK